MDNRISPINIQSIHIPVQDAQQTIRVMQITDCHLAADPQWCLAGVNTQKSFEQVIALSQQRWAEYELAIFTGDLVHDASVTGYQRFKQHLQQLPTPAVCIPGNHDLPAILSDNLNEGNVSTAKVITLGDWLLVMLDSTIRGSERGHLHEKELEFLESTLAQNSDKHTLICLHHHPVFINSKWMDGMALQNPDAFFGILDQFPNVKGIIWGHIHQAFDDNRYDVKLMGTPSTCLQFIPNQPGFGIDAVAPGYRWLELSPDGSIASGVERIESIPTGLDLSSGGY